MKELNFQPIFLIGAARSGTKMLRDVLATHPDISKIDFDINFIWKIKNTDIPHDELDPEQARDEVKKFIRGYFTKAAAGKPFLLEKTVSNTLRIPFLKAVFPEAKFIHLYRNGLDVSESVARQWGTVPPRSYLIKKITTLPVQYVLPYAMRYGWDLLKIKLTGASAESYVWGVKYKGFEKDLAEMDTLQFCATQWSKCTEKSLADFADFPKNSYLTIPYEKFVQNPEPYIQEVSAFLTLKSPEKVSTSTISRQNVGKAKAKLSIEEINSIKPIIAKSMRAFGYPI